jgi:2-polyprenyl-3-methyl-5-hydroxy-6-metoxy-1,4-benzoquinol methylase
MSGYDDATINSKNPFARFAHRTRLRKSIELARNYLEAGRILDYGCGSGVFIKEINRIRPGIAVGYEPFMKERNREGLPIYREFKDVKDLAPFGTITLFETIEHLSDVELEDFLSDSTSILSNDGKILISAPIEIGPALFLKELNRSLLRCKKSEYSFWGFFKAAVFGIPPQRANDIKRSHCGFDFRQAIREIEAKGWTVSILGFSPIPLLGWYGNSQVFLLAQKQTNSTA